MSNLKARVCAIRGCNNHPVCLDNKGYTKWRSEGDLNLFRDEFFLEEGDRETWFCQEHAEQYLFPLIDREVGYTTRDIVREMREGGLM